VALLLCKHATLLTVLKVHIRRFIGVYQLYLVNYEPSVQFTVHGIDHGGKEHARSISEVVLLRQLHLLGVLELSLHLGDLSLIDGDLARGKNGSLNKGEVGFAKEIQS